MCGNEISTQGNTKYERANEETVHCAVCVLIYRVRAARTRRLWIINSQTRHCDVRRFRSRFPDSTRPESASDAGRGFPDDPRGEGIVSARIGMTTWEENLEDTWWNTVIRREKSSAIRQDVRALQRQKGISHRYKVVYSIRESKTQLLQNAYDCFRKCRFNSTFTLLSFIRDRCRRRAWFFFSYIRTENHFSRSTRYSIGEG